MPVQNSSQTPSSSTTKTQPTDIKALKQSVRVHFAEYQTFGRKTVAEAWFAGQALHEIKSRLPHGEFRVYLETEGIAIETARRFMRLSREVQMNQLGSFASMDAALKSIPANTPNRPDVDPSEPTKEEIKEFEQEQVLHRVEHSEAELDSARAEIVRLTALSPDADPSPPPDDALERANARASETWTLLQAERKANMKLKRRLSAIKNAMSDGKPVDEILALHYGCKVKGAEVQAVLGVGSTS